MFVDYLNETNWIKLNLSDELSEYRGEVEKAIAIEFAYESINRQTINKMDEFVQNWFESRGINMKKENFD